VLARVATALALLATLSACPPPSSSATDAGCAASPEGCALAAAPSCPSGSMPRVGQDTCVTVGWSDCPQGFTAAPSGFGCVEVLPPAACSGPTRATLGLTSCQPVGDCGAPFPPPAATLFVAPSGPTDATHFTSINDALRAAPAGATIAVAAGTYTESLAFPKPVTLVGRCAAHVKLDVLDNAYTGLDGSGTKGVVVSGLTVTRATFGAQVFGGGELTLRDVVLDSNLALGFISSGTGSSLTLERCVVRGTRQKTANTGWGGVAEGGGFATVRQTEVSGNTQVGLVARDQNSHLVVEASSVTATNEAPAGSMGRGLIAQGGALLEVRECAVVGNHDLGLFVAEEGSTANLTRSVIRATAPKSTTGLGGRGLGVQEGGQVILDSVSISGNHEAGVTLSSLPTSPQSVLTAIDAVIEGTLPSATATGGAPNVQPQYGGWGLVLQRAGRATLTGCALVGNTELGVMGSDPGTLLSLSATLVSGTQENRDGAYGRGLALQLGAQTQLDGCALVDNVEVGVDLDGTGGSTARLDGTLVRHTLASTKSGVTGNGVIARYGARLDVNGSVIDLNPGPALTFDASAGTIARSRLSDNGVGLHAQHGSAVTQVQAMPATVGPLDVFVGQDTVFARNQSNQGTGTVALPPGLTAPTP
jgi:hypothetical protein